LGVAISLILTFRINQSYERWWEARKIWGSIVNDSRTLTRQVLTFPKTGVIDPAELGQIQQRIAYRQISWSFVLGQSLRGFDTLESEGINITKEDRESIHEHDNVSNTLLLLHSRDIAMLHSKGVINDYQQVQMDATVARLCDWMGMSERIKNTVFPKLYTLTLQFFLYLFVMLLPLGIIEYFGISEAAFIILISAPFFMLEKTALYLQNPFENHPTDISVTAIAKNIETNIRHMLDEKFEQPEEKSKFYLM
jgi:putative membrane protein